MTKRLNKQETKEKSSVVKIEAFQIKDSVTSCPSRRIDGDNFVKVDHCSNSFSSTDNIKTSGGAVIIN